MVHIPGLTCILPFIASRSHLSKCHRLVTRWSLARCSSCFISASQRGSLYSIILLQDHSRGIYSCPTRYSLYISYLPWQRPMWCSARRPLSFMFRGRTSILYTLRADQYPLYLASRTFSSCFVRQIPTQPCHFLGIFLVSRCCPSPPRGAASPREALTPSSPCLSSLVIFPLAFPYWLEEAISRCLVMVSLIVPLALGTTWI